MLYEKLPLADRTMIQNYVDTFARSGAKNTRDCDLQYLLRYWDDAKSTYLWRMLGETFMVSKPIVYNRDLTEIEYDLDTTVFSYRSEAGMFVDAYRNAIDKNFLPYCNDKQYSTKAEREHDEKIADQLYELIRSSTLAKNVYEGDSFMVEYKDKKPLRINKGAKVSRALGQLATLFDLDGYEKFRVLHSQCLNEKCYKGDLVLSIHPLDYMTMSDNANGWTSCMNWTDEGEYHRGTVEMMNSTCVVEAYIASSEEFAPCYGVDWNSKKWRELFVVTPALIAGIKGYPTWNRNVEELAIMFIRELAQTNLGWGPYNCEPQYINNGNCAVTFDEFGKSVLFNFYTDAMYCDFYDKHKAVISVNCPVKVEVNYSGASECMCCGEVGDFDNEGELLCYNCSNNARCYNCGDRWDMDEMRDVDGDLYCPYCAEDMPLCSSCGDIHHSDCMTFINLADKVGVLFTDDGDRCFCENCMAKFDIAEPGFRDHIQKYSRHWSYYQYFTIDDVPECVKDFFEYDEPAEDREYRFKFEEHNED